MGFLYHQEKITSLHPTYYYQAHACILVFDVTRKSTYHDVIMFFSLLFITIIQQ
jgi:Rab-like protein 2